MLDLPPQFNSEEKKRESRWIFTIKNGQTFSEIKKSNSEQTKLDGRGSFYQSISPVIFGNKKIILLNIMQEKGNLRSKDSTMHQILKGIETKQKWKMLNLTICTLKFPALTIHRGFPLCWNPKSGIITNCLHGRSTLPTSVCVT